MKDLLNGWGATAVVFLPLVGAAVMLAIPKSEENLHKVVALFTSLVALAVGVALMGSFDFDQTAKLQFLQDKTWIEVINSRFIVGIDGISLPLIALTVFVVPTMYTLLARKRVPGPKKELALDPQPGKRF